MSSRYFSIGLLLLLASGCGGGSCPPEATYQAVSGGGYYCICPAGTVYKNTGGAKSCASTTVDPPPPVPDAGGDLASTPPPQLPANCHLYDAAVSSTRAYCTGIFQAGEAVKLCPAGWRVCTASDALPASLQAACTDSRIGGFMVADIPSYHDPANPTQGVCTQFSGWNPGLAGCGQEKPSATFVVPTCFGWQRSLICSQSTSITCAGGNVATAANTSPNNGASCCK